MIKDLLQKYKSGNMEEISNLFHDFFGDYRDLSSDVILKRVMSRLCRYEDHKKELLEIDFPFPDATIQERIHSLVTGLYRETCPNGNQTKYNKNDGGKIGYCGTNHCACFLLNKKEKIKNLSPEIWDNRNEKSKITMTERYGVESVFQLDSVRQKNRESQTPEMWDKIKNTIRNRYGVENPLQNEDIKEKARATLIERYGVDNPSKSEEVKQKVRKTFSQNFPDGYTPIIEKRQKTSLDRYGVDNPMKNKEVNQKVRQSLIKNYANPDKKEVILKKYKDTSSERHGVSHPSQKHYTEETRRILNDKEEFYRLFSTMSVPSLAELIGVNSSTVFDYANLYEIEYHSSSFERDISTFLKENNIDFVSRTRKIIPPLELDFYIESRKLAIEFNGLYWHSDQKVSNDYHRKKYLACKQNEVRLIMINEDEWLERADVVKSKILNLCGLSQKGPPARKLTVGKVTANQANVFFDKHHLQGKNPSIIFAYGAFDSSGLVACVAFSKQRGTQKTELIRYCTDGKTYAGVFSKLLKHSLNEIGVPEIVSFADLRYSDGHLYEHCGFVLDSEVTSDYKYVLNNKTFHKSSFTKKNIERKFGIDMSCKTEREAMAELGFSRIYDCGKLKYVWSKPI